MFLRHSMHRGLSCSINPFILKNPYAIVCIAVCPIRFTHSGSALASRRIVKVVLLWQKNKGVCRYGPSTAFGSARQETNDRTNWEFPFEAAKWRAVGAPTLGSAKAGFGMGFLMGVLSFDGSLFESGGYHHSLILCYVTEISFSLENSIFPRNVPKTFSQKIQKSYIPTTSDKLLHNYAWP